jgi:hypothetical protein
MQTTKGEMKMITAIIIAIIMLLADVFDSLGDIAEDLIDKMKK